MQARPTPTHHHHPFASLHPAWKLAAWGGAIALLAGAFQAVALGLGLEFNILRASGGGRGVLLGIALTTLLCMMAIDGRPSRDYGLVAHVGWKRRLLAGFALGAAALAGYWLIAVRAGAAGLATDSLTARRCAKATLAALTAFPVALVQQIIFSGYLVSMLRSRYRRATAVVAAALLFSVLHRIDRPAMLLSADNLPELTGMCLLGVLLGTMRLESGSIFQPTGFLAGAIFVRRWLRKTSLVAFEGQGPWSDWLGMDADPLQSPVVWAALAAGTAWVTYRLIRAGEPGETLKADPNFKRVFPLSNSTMLSPLDVWLGRLADARFRVGMAYLPRLAAILAFSTLVTFLTAVERLLAPLVVRWRRVRDPVIIVGVHRSGTTHLHNLLALDPQFAAPRAHQVLNPSGFVFFGWLMTPLLAAFVPSRRPMDGVRFHVFSPQEDEFALAGMCRVSPHWGMTFPRRWAAYDRYIFPAAWTPRERRLWQGHLLLFLRKLVLWSGKRPLLKNPYHTGRVGLLRTMFPGVRLIHVHRHPYDVYRSNMHLAREGHVVNQLQDPEPADNYQTRFLENYRAMEESFYRETEDLAAGQVADVRFEDVESDPVGQMRAIYAALGLEFTPRYEDRLRHYLASIAGYQKNRFRELPETDRHAVDAALGEFLDRWGYRPPAGACEAEGKEGRKAA